MFNCFEVDMFVFNYYFNFFLKSKMYFVMEKLIKS